MVSMLSAVRRLICLVELCRTLVHVTKDWDPLGINERSMDKPGKGKNRDTEVIMTRLELLRELLDTTSILADFVFLVGRLHLLPLSQLTIKRLDKLATLTTLTSSTIGLVQIAQSNRDIYREGRESLNSSTRLSHCRFLINDMLLNHRIDSQGNGRAGRAIGAE